MTVEIASAMSSRQKLGKWQRLAIIIAGWLKFQACDWPPSADSLSLVLLITLY
jgi:hypothetical protein